MVRLLAEMGQAKYAKAKPFSIKDTGMASEEAEIEALMQTDIDSYRHKPWRATGMTGAERLLALKRENTPQGRR